MRGRNEKMIRIARCLRADQMDAETVLWNRLRNRQLDGHKFARQVPIGGYVCDFVCREKQVVIEVDGGQHTTSPRRTKSATVGSSPMDTRYCDFGTMTCSAISRAS
ncbi:MULTISPECIES: endonuclease domain-containing protein [unclassified Bradyrhizobium]